MDVRPTSILSISFNFFQFTLNLCLLLFSQPYGFLIKKNMFIDFREIRRGERKRETSMWETSIVWLSYAPQLGIEPTT